MVSGADTSAVTVVLKPRVESDSVTDTAITPAPYPAGTEPVTAAAAGERCSTALLEIGAPMQMVDAGPLKLHDPPGG